MRSSRVRKFKSPYRTFIFVSKLFLIWYLLLFVSSYMNQPTDATFTESYVVESKIQGDWETEKEKPKAAETEVVEEEEPVTEVEEPEIKNEEKVESDTEEQVVEEVNNEEQDKSESDEEVEPEEEEEPEEVTPEEDAENIEEKEDPESDEEDI